MKVEYNKKITIFEPLKYPQFRLTPTGYSSICKHCNKTENDHIVEFDDETMEVFKVECPKK